MSSVIKNIGSYFTRSKKKPGEEIPTYDIPPKNPIKKDAAFSSYSPYRFTAPYLAIMDTFHDFKDIEGILCNVFNYELTSSAIVNSGQYEAFYKDQEFNRVDSDIIRTSYLNSLKYHKDLADQGPVPLDDIKRDIIRVFDIRFPNNKLENSDKIKLRHPLFVATNYLGETIAADALNFIIEFIRNKYPLFENHFADKNDVKLDVTFPNLIHIENTGGGYYASKKKCFKVFTNTSNVSLDSYFTNFGLERNKFDSGPGVPGDSVPINNNQSRNAIFHGADADLKNLSDSFYNEKIIFNMAGTEFNIDFKEPENYTFNGTNIQGTISYLGGQLQVVFNTNVCKDNSIGSVKKKIEEISVQSLPIDIDGQVSITNNEDRKRFIRLLLGFKRAGDWLQAKFCADNYILFDGNDFWSRMVAIYFGAPVIEQIVPAGERKMELLLTCKFTHLFVFNSGPSYRHLSRLPFKVNGTNLSPVQAQYKIFDQIMGTGPLSRSIFNKYKKYKTKYQNLKKELQSKGII